MNLSTQPITGDSTQAAAILHPPALSERVPPLLLVAPALTPLRLLRTTWRIASSLILPLLLAGFGHPIHATEVSGSISSSTTWTASESPYEVTGNITVDEGATLTLEPGVEVRFGAELGMLVPASVT